MMTRLSAVFGFPHGRGLMWVGLASALMLSGCTGSAAPKLEDLSVGQSRPDGAPPPALMPPNGTSTAAAPPARSPAREYRDQPLAQQANPQIPSAAPATPPSRTAGSGDMIVGFKGATVVLFGDESGQEGERVATSSLTIPLQMKRAASNVSRVQIDTPYGPRWVSRSEITIATDGTAPIRR